MRWEELLCACGLFTERVERGEGPEVFLDLTRLADPAQALAELRALLVPRLGSHLWVSLAPNKLLARVATLAQRAGRLRGAGGVVTVPLGREAAFLAPLPVSYLWPLEPRLLSRLALLGLGTIGQVAALPEEELYRFFGPQGYRLANLSRGRDSSRVKGEPPAYLEYRSPWEGEAERSRLAAWCAAAAGHLARAEQRRGAWGKRLELTLFLEAGAPLTQVRELNRPELEAAELASALLRLLPGAPPERLSAVAVRLGPLVPLLPAQLSLLPAARPPRERLLKVVSRLQERYPGRVDWGSRWRVNRREQVLAFFDPLRRAAAPQGGKGAGQGAAS